MYKFLHEIPLCNGSLFQFILYKFIRDIPLCNGLLFQFILRELKDFLSSLKPNVEGSSTEDPQLIYVFINEFNNHFINHQKILMKAPKELLTRI